MKRIFLLFAILGALSGAAQANALIGGFDLIMSNISGTGDYSDLAKDYTMRIGYGFGGFFSWDLRPRLSLQTGLAYETRGAEKSHSATITYRSYPNAIYTDATTIANSYLQVPALFSYNVIPFLNLFAGPELSFLLTSRSVGQTTIRYNNTTENTTIDTDTRALMTAADFGLSLGATYLFVNQIVVSAAMDFGFIGIDANPPANWQGAERNFAMKVGVGYRFDLKQ